MMMVTTSWTSVMDAFGAGPSGLAAIAAGGGLLCVVWLVRRALHGVRRVVRNRRVARELQRTHQAAYRERFGARGRLA